MIIIRAAKMQQVKGKQKKSRGLCQVEKEAPFYLAVDIGTTTVSIGLYNGKGEYLGGKARDNEQGKLGSDIMMRLMHVSEGRGEMLSCMIRTQIWEMVNDIWKGIGKGIEEFDQIEKMTVVGNTAMCHLFLGENTEGLAKAPFYPAYRGTYRCLGEKFGWQNGKKLSVTVLPGIAAHVGADAAAVIGAEKLWNPDKIQLAVDLGTNAEIILNDHGKISVCSTAAGPAFEGKGIACGCRAREGAINGVRMIRGNGNIILDMVCGREGQMAEPIGICGSGLVDIVAQMRYCGLLQPDGYLPSRDEVDSHMVPSEWINRFEEGKEGEQYFVLYDSEKDRRLWSGKPDETRRQKIYISQKDIRSFQLAKAAIQAGVQVLLKRQGILLQEVDEIKIAGVFGTFLHPENARSCGLVPDVPIEKIEFIGNAAERGAAVALFEPNFLTELEKRLQTITHIELANEPEFAKQFMNAMELK